MPHSPSLIQQARQTIALAMPIIVAQLAGVAIGIATTLMIGRLGGDALAAGGLGLTLFASFQVIAQALLSSVGVTVAHALGGGRSEQVGAYVESGFRFALLVTLPTMLVLWAIPYVFAWLAVEPATVAAATPFLQILSLSVLPALLLTILRYFLMAIGRQSVATLIAIAGVGLTVLCNELLVFGALGLPAMGLVGAAWSSLLVNLAMLLLTALYIEWHPQTRRFRIWRPLTRVPDSFRELISLSWPAATASSFESLFFSLISTLAARFAPAELAAHMIALNCCFVTFMLAVGLSQATLVRIAAAAGAGDPVAVRRVGLSGILMGLIGMGIGALILLLAPRLIVSLFVDLGDPANRPVLESALPLLVIAALFQLFDGAQAIASGALRGLRDTRGPMMIAAIAYWPAGMGLALLLGFELDMRVVGLWWGMALGLAISAMLMSWRLARRIKALANRLAGTI